MKKSIKKHDLHIHTKLSLCSGDPLATLENYIDRASELGIEIIGISDHMWESENIPTDNEWYKEQSYERQLAIREVIPKDLKGVKLLWGCETEYAMGKVGITKERAKELDYVLIPHSHFHMKGFTIPEEITEPSEIAKYGLKTFKEVAELGIATGIAHPFDACLFAGDDEKFKLFFNSISNEEFEECFKLAKENNVGIEINISSFTKGVNHPIYDETYYRMLKVAKAVGCKFYFGSDTHSIRGLELVLEEEKIVKVLNLEETDLIDLIR